MIDYIRDGQEIYRNSFAIIREEARLDRIPADLEKLAVRVIHACGMVDAIDGLQFSRVPARPGVMPWPPARRSSAMRGWCPRVLPVHACQPTTR